ncbi:hypothetical protein EJ08DRAFT_61438 [Tothia fuscella]|uniref:Uncharacterized protein n=1 Tax=Tothia fuscella TaxID=1048955 RepID=A0A9P4U0J0_9PEZI|nr:hypothetical protein EJ08DRAFT_61438 [Tothia fuscella]
MERTLSSPANSQTTNANSRLPFTKIKASFPAKKSVSIKRVLKMETLRALSPRPLSPYTDNVDRESLTLKGDQRKLVVVQQMESEDPFSDADARHENSHLSGSFSLFGCLRWSFLSIMRDLKALFVASRYRPGIQPQRSDEPRTMLWRDRNNPYVSFGKGQSRMKLEEVDEMV